MYVIRLFGNRAEPFLFDHLHDHVKVFEDRRVAETYAKLSFGRSIYGRTTATRVYSVELESGEQRNYRLTRQDKED